MSSRPLSKVELDAAQSVARPASDSADIDLVMALGRLPPRDRELIALSYIAGMTSSEIGRLLGLTPAGIRTRRARILQRLREELERGG